MNKLHSINLSCFVFFSLVITFFSCKTPTKSTTNNDSKPPKTTDKGEREFEEYLDRKKEKFKGQAAPDVIITTIDGKSYKLADFQGKIVLLNFWFAACKPCMTEIASLNELHDKYHAQKVVVLSVSTDNKETAKRLSIEKKMRYLVAADGKNLTNQLDISTFPTSFLIDKRGIIQEIFIGANDFDATYTYREVKPHLERLLER